MSLSELASLGSFVSGFAVLVSLVYLALQVRQTERNQRALMQSERATRQGNYLRFLADPLIVSAFAKGRSGAADITIEEYRQYYFIFRAAITNWEDVFFQHQRKVLDDASFESTLAVIRNAFAYPGNRINWKRQRVLFEPSFREFVDRLMSETDVVRMPAENDELQTWHSEIATELLKAQP